MAKLNEKQIDARLVIALVVNELHHYNAGKSIDFEEVEISIDQVRDIYPDYLNYVTNLIAKDSSFQDSINRCSQITKHFRDKVLELRPHLIKAWKQEKLERKAKTLKRLADYDLIMS